MQIKTLESFQINIYLSGPIEVAKQVLREEFLREGCCATITPTHFVYTGGEESGYVVGMLDYPRFPCGSKTLEKRALKMARLLLARTFQHSALIVTPKHTVWISTRKP